MNQTILIVLQIHPDILHLHHATIVQKCNLGGKIEQQVNTPPYQITAFKCQVKEKDASFQCMYPYWLTLEPSALSNNNVLYVLTATREIFSCIKSRTQYLPATRMQPTRRLSQNAGCGFRIYHKTSPKRHHLPLNSTGLSVRQTATCL